MLFDESQATFVTAYMRSRVEWRPGDSLDCTGPYTRCSGNNVCVVCGGLGQRCCPGASKRRLVRRAVRVQQPKQSLRSVRRRQWSAALRRRGLLRWDLEQQHLSVTRGHEDPFCP
jgi:hypothetical protein